MAGSQQVWLLLPHPGRLISRRVNGLRSNRHVASIARSFHASRYFLFGISQDFWFFCCLSVTKLGAQRWHHVDSLQAGKKKKTYIESGTCCHFDILSFWGVSLVSSSFLFSSLHLGQELKENEPPFQRWCQPGTLMGSTNQKIVKPSDFYKAYWKV